MAEQLYALGDIGATNMRIGVYTDRSECAAVFRTGTDPGDYEGTLERIAETVDILSRERGEIVAASVAVAAEVGDDGVLTRSGGLSPWIGRNLGEDLGQALDLPEGLVGTPNDVVAIALSQQEVNARNGRPARGIATTLSSGWGGALYWEEGKTKSDEPGHEHLRDGATCPCGQDGHAEAFISGGGIELNEHMTMEEWLSSTPGAGRQLVVDISDATVAMIERHAADNDFEAEEIRWTGGVALGQPFMMQRVAENVRERSPGVAFDMVTMGEQAGLHGTFIDARRRAVQY